MGIPVITNAGVGDVEEITTKYNAGIVLKKLKTEDFNIAADLIAGGKSFNKEEISRGAMEFYNLDSAVKKYWTVYKNILDKDL